MVAEKGDLKISGTIPVQNFFAAQVAFSPLQNVNLSLSYFAHERIVERNSFTTNGESFSAALGFYVPYIGTHQKRIIVLLDSYLGYTRSSIYNQYSSITAAQLNYQKFSLSAGLHVKAKWLAISYAVKLSSLDYQKGEIYGLSQNQILQPVNQEILLNEPYFLLETDFRISIGPEAFRGFIGVTMLNPNMLEKVLINEQNPIFSLGLNLGIDELIRLKKNK